MTTLSALTPRNRNCSIGSCRVGQSNLSAQVLIREKAVEFYINQSHVRIGHTNAEAVLSNCQGVHRIRRLALENAGKLISIVHSERNRYHETE